MTKLFRSLSCEPALGPMPEDQIHYMNERVPPGRIIEYLSRFFADDMRLDDSRIRIWSELLTRDGAVVVARSYPETREYHCAFMGDDNVQLQFSVKQSSGGLYFELGQAAFSDGRMYSDLKVYDDKWTV